MIGSDRITQTSEVDISGIVQDVALSSGITIESVKAVEAEITSGGLLRLTISGEKDLHSTEHRLPAELRGGDCDA